MKVLFGLKSTITVGLFICSLALSPVGFAASPPQVVKVLGFGTSNLLGPRRFLSQIAEASGAYHIEHEQWILNPMGLRLEGLWKAIEESEKDPNNNAPSVRQKGKSVRDYLQKEKWDVILLSSHYLTGTLSFGKATTTKQRQTEQEALVKCIAYIKKHAPHAKLFYYNIYNNGPAYDELEYIQGADRTRDYVTPLIKQTGMLPFELFIRDVTTDIGYYHEVCEQFSLEGIPARQAVWLAHADPDWGYIHNPVKEMETLVSPELPPVLHRPTLAVGPVWKYNKKLKKPYMKLDLHVNMAGSYMLACLIFQAITGHDTIGNSFIPEKKAQTWDASGRVIQLLQTERLTAEECSILQKIAANALLLEKKQASVFITEYQALRKQKHQKHAQGFYQKKSKN